MKFNHKFIAIVFLSAFFITTAFSQQMKLFSDIKVTPRWVIGPDIQARDRIERGSSTQTRWLQIDVDFKTTVMRQGWLDDVVFKYDVLLPQVTKRQVVLSGQIKYWSLAMDGEIHHVQAFIHPRFLQRYVPGLKMRKSNLKDLRILITVLQNDSPIGMGVYKPKSSTSSKTIKAEIDKALASRTTFKGKDSIFGRDETPWGVLNVDYYELIKKQK